MSCYQLCYSMLFLVSGELLSVMLFLVSGELLSVMLFNVISSQW